MKSLEELMAIRDQMKDKEKVTYVKMNAEKAKEVVERHLKGGAPVTEYTIGKVLS